MNVTQITEMVARSYLHRPGLLTSNTNILTDALALIHQDMQLRHNFRCMEATTDVTIAAESTDGATLPDGFKTAREVFLVGDDGTMTASLDPATEEMVNLVRRVGQQRDGLRTTLDANYQQRYYVKDGRLHLLLTDTAAITLRLDYYQFLSVPAEAGTNDLTTKYFAALASGMASQAAKWLGDTDRAAIFATDYETALAGAIEDDTRSKQGPAYDVCRPPLPQRRRY